MPDKIHRDFSNMLGQARGLLEDYANLGIDRVILPGAVAGGPGQVADAAGPETLELIREELGDCRRCKLSGGRTHIVYGVGNPEARLVLVGEGPGREEDLRGEPFVGEAGRLLDRILFAMGLRREDVYICNVVKCRPPQNRDPEQDEIDACEPFLRRQIAAISPQVIVTLGRFAAQSLLQDQTAVSRLRGHWREYQGVPLMPTFHPAYLLRNPVYKREVWEDMKSVVQRLRAGGG